MEIKCISVLIAAIGIIGSSLCLIGSGKPQATVVYAED